MTARLCPKHSKPFPCGKCRIENAQKPAQAAPSRIAVVSEPAVALGPVKRGRPRKYVDAASRQAAYRDRLTAKEQDSERRNVLAKILKLVKASMVSSILKFGDQIHTENRLRLANLHDALKSVSLEKLTEYLETLEEHPDLEGRMWGERSGEKERAYGQSEIERIIAARQHDVSLGETSWQDPKMAGGFRVRPKGAAPDSSEETGEDNVRPASIKAKEMPASEKRRDLAIARVVSQMFDSGNGRCLFCDEVFTDKLVAERHLFDMYGQGEKEDRKWGKHMSAIIHFSAKTSMGAELYKEQSVSVATHHRQLIEQEARRRKFGNIVTDRFETEESPHLVDSQTVASA
jgi:hypothetical protein